MKRAVVIAAITVSVASGIMFYMTKDTTKQEVPKQDYIAETTKTEVVDKETGSKAIIETPILPPQPEIKPQPVKQLEEAPAPVDIRTYARNLLEYRTGRTQEHFWTCFDNLMQQAHNWELTESEVDKIIDRMTVFTSTCSALELYKRAGTYY